jgi:hypothetical protein
MDYDMVARPHYFERQFLRTQDFVAEQAYQLTTHRRHTIAEHIWGIVRGLELTIDADGDLSVLPGMAVDGYGRVLLLAHQQSILKSIFDDKGDTLEVWAVYRQTPADPAQNSTGACFTDNPDGFYRWQEEAQIEILPPNLAFPERRQPPGVPEGDVDFDPSRTPPDSPLDRWPVFLGQVERARPGPNKPYVYNVDLSDRPYAGLVGEAIQAPSGRARVQVGAERRDDTRRFAVFLQEPDVADPSRPVEETEPRLEIARDGALTMRSHTTINGDLTVNGGSLIFGVGSPPVHAAPWRIYHVIGKKPKDTTAPRPEQLRIEMADPESRPKGFVNQVAIGKWSAQAKQFVPCLTVDDDCTVTIYGTLVVHGLIKEQATFPAQDVNSLALIAGGGPRAPLLGVGEGGEAEAARALLRAALTVLERDRDQAAAFANLAKNAPVTRRRLLLALMDTLDPAEKAVADPLIEKLKGEGPGA